MTKEQLLQTIPIEKLEALVDEESKLMAPAAMGDEDAKKRIIEIQEQLNPIIQQAARELTGASKKSS